MLIYIITWWRSQSTIAARNPSVRSNSKNPYATWSSKSRRKRSYSPIYLGAGEEGRKTGELEWLPEGPPSKRIPILHIRFGIQESWWNEPQQTLLLQLAPRMPHETQDDLRNWKVKLQILPRPRGQGNLHQLHRLGMFLISRCRRLNSSRNSISDPWYHILILNYFSYPCSTSDKDKGEANRK